MVRLQDVATVTQGTVLSRVETSPEDKMAQVINLYTMKDMNESLGMDYRGDSERVISIPIETNKLSKLKLASEKMVVVNLISQKAVAIRAQHNGLLIPSNFVIIEGKEHLAPLYFEWYFNEHPFCRKQLLIARQGTSISPLSIQMLRELEIVMPPVEKQELIGKMYRGIKKKQTLQMEQKQLEEQFMNYTIINAIGDIHNDNQ